MLLLALLVSQAITVRPTAEARTDTLVGHYIGAIRDLREDVLYGGLWGWNEQPGGCAVVISGTDNEVVWSKRRDVCNSVVLRSKVSIVTIDLLIEAIDRMDRLDVRTLEFSRSAAQSLIDPVYPERWKTLRQAEDLFK
jgi:hypothetical protein